jgi:hypothetical protein
MFGPESSLLAIASTTVAVALLLRVTRRRALWFKPEGLGTKSADIDSAKPTGVTESPLWHLGTRR